MKRIKNLLPFVLFSLTLLLTSTLSYGQHVIYLGVKGGISIPNLTSASSVKTDWDEGYSSRIGPYVGMLAEVQLSKLFSIQPEINFIGEGGKRKGIQPFSIPNEYLDIFHQTFQTDKDYVYADFNNVSRINYIQIPIMAKINLPLGKNGKLKFFAQVGPYVSYLVGAKQIVKSDHLKVYLDKEGNQQIPPELIAAAFGTKLDTTIEAKDDLHKANMGVQGEIGFSYECGRGKFFIEGGGNYGFINIQKGDEHGKNNIGAGTVSVGYAMKFPFTKQDSH